MNKTNLVYFGISYLCLLAILSLLLGLLNKQDLGALVMLIGIISFFVPLIVVEMKRLLERWG